MRIEVCTRCAASVRRRTAEIDVAGVHTAHTIFGCAGPVVAVKYLQYSSF